MHATQQTRPVAVSSPLGEDVLLFLRMHAVEHLGQPSHYSLEVLSEKPALVFEELLGENVTVRLDQGSGQSRYFNGIVSQFGQLGSFGRYTRYEITLHSWLWFLTRSADCRIFQNETVPNIIKAVFRNHAFNDIDDRLTASYRTLEYCVQYRETAFNFVSRLMEMEGIYYYFLHQEDKHMLVLCDDISGHVPYSGYEEIPYRAPESPDVHQREHISRWCVSMDVEAGKYELTDFDFKRPRLALRARSDNPRQHTHGAFEVYDYPGEYVEPSEGESYSKIRLEELQAQHERIRGESNARGIAAGSLFRLTGQPREDQNREYLVVAAQYDLRSDVYESTGDVDSSLVYSCTFEAIPSDVRYRPQRLTPRPVVEGPHTAMVVGMKGEEIWTDLYGRIKVQFHWDRLGTSDENSSCWIRVAQPWGGKQWGSMYLPRIGHEVVVEFLEGDPDRPIVTGSFYNGDAKPPYVLPANKTISTLKSNSSKGGAGFNEIRFDDLKGDEQIFLHAEKNLDLRVKNDRFESVLNDRHLVVYNDKFEHVKNERHEKVVHDHLEEVGGDRHVTILGHQAVSIGKTLSLTVADDVSEAFKKNHAQEVAQQLFLKADTVVIEGLTNVTLKVGQSFIAIDASGIKLGTTGDIALEAQAKAAITGTAGLTLESPAMSELKGAQVTVNGQAMVQIQGGIVKIN